jgi:hypothetical protein
MDKVRQMGFPWKKWWGCAIRCWMAQAVKQLPPRTLALVWGTGHRWMGFILGDAWRERLGDEL